MGKDQEPLWHDFVHFSAEAAGTVHTSGPPKGGILIDAGVSAKRIETACWDRGIGMDSIRGIFVTHGAFRPHGRTASAAKTLGIPVFASPGHAPD